MLARKVWYIDSILNFCILPLRAVRARALGTVTQSGEGRMSGTFRALIAFIVAAIAPTLLTASAFAEGVLVCGNRATDGVTGCAINYNYPTAAAAYNAGIAQCVAAGLLNCKILATFRTSCYAYAFTHGAGGWGANGGADLASAQTAAIASCQDDNPGFSCYVHGSACDTVDEHALRQAQEEKRAEEQKKLRKRQRPSPKHEPGSRSSTTKSFAPRSRKRADEQAARKRQADAQRRARTQIRHDILF